MENFSLFLVSYNPANIYLFKLNNRNTKKRCVFIVNLEQCSLGSFRSSPSKVFSGKGVLKICSKFTGEHLCLRTPLEGCFLSLWFVNVRSMFRPMLQSYYMKKMKNIDIKWVKNAMHQIKNQLQ